MKIVSWNVWGVGLARKRGVIKGNLKRIRPDIVILLETKKESLNERWIGSMWKGRYKSWVAFPSVGRAGGVVIIWDCRTVNVIYSSVGEFSVLIRVENGGVPWWFSGAYGPNSYNEQRAFGMSWQD